MSSTDIDSTLTKKVRLREAIFQTFSKLILSIGLDGREVLQKSNTTLVDPCGYIKRFRRFFIHRRTLLSKLDGVIGVKLDSLPILFV